MYHLGSGFGFSEGCVRNLAPWFVSRSLTSLWGPRWISQTNSLSGNRFALEVFYLSLLLSCNKHACQIKEISGVQKRHERSNSQITTSADALPGCLKIQTIMSRPGRKYSKYKSYKRNLGDAAKKRKMKGGRIAPKNAPVLTHCSFRYNVVRSSNSSATTAPPKSFRVKGKVDLSVAKQVRTWKC